MKIYANDVDPVACAVLRATLPGARVDERSIKDVRPEDLVGFDRVHMFAGAGIWDAACELAGWRRPIWTASCPCQPFSVAGKGAGEDDPRHLWPDLFRLVRECRPGIIVGEQVGGAAGDAWLDRVGADLESENFTFWAAEVPASSVNAPHQRLRNFWVAVADADAASYEKSRNVYGETRKDRRGANRQPRQIGNSSGNIDECVADARSGSVWSGGSSEDIGSSRSTRGEALQQRIRSDNRAGDGLERMADTDRSGRDGWQKDAERLARRRDATERTDVELEHAESERRREGRPEYELRRGRDAAAGSDGPSVTPGDLAHTDGSGYSRDDYFGYAGPGHAGASDHRSFWMDAEWLDCADGKARRAKPGIRLLVDGMAGRADLWRLAGNSIIPQLAAEVLRALQDELDAIGAS